MTLATNMRTISRIYPNHTSFARFVSRMTLNQRSVTIKCCQAQKIPSRDTDSPLLQMILSAGPVYLGLTNPEPFLETLQTFESQINGPVSAAISLDICRSLPLQLPQIDEAILKSWNKEIECCETHPSPSQINWDTIFDPLRHHEPIMPCFPPNEPMAVYVYASLCRWKESLRGRLLYPRATHKNMSRSTRREFEEVTGKDLDNVPIFGQDDWLKLYMDSGIELGGVCEMRTKWYPSGAKPRTYYAQGGESYKYSAHLQNPFSALVNSMTITHHVTRLLPSRLFLRNERQHFLIYDLTSFTSRMDEQRHFCRKLAEHCYGVEVFIMDVREGVLSKDLGELLDDYCDHCVEFPKVSYERFPGRGGDHLISEHAKASMLGIFGNLMTCTFAHGAVLAQVVHSDNEVNVAGDDGVVLEDDERPYLVDLGIRSLGDYEREKTFSSRDDAAICLKRPIHQTGTRLYHGTACIPPNMALYHHLLEGIEDPRYTFMYPDLSQAEKVSIVGKDLMRFLRSVHRSSWKLDDVELGMAVSVAKGFTSLTHMPPEGRLMNCGDSLFWPNVPHYPEDLRLFDPMYCLVLARYRGNATISLRERREDVDISDWQPGEVRQGNKSIHLGFLEKLGFLECSKEELEDLEGDAGFLKLLGRLTEFSDEPEVSNMLLLKAIPYQLIIS